MAEKFVNVQLNRKTYAVMFMHGIPVQVRCHCRNAGKEYWRLTWAAHHRRVGKTALLVIEAARKIQPNA